MRGRCWWPSAMASRALLWGVSFMAANSSQLAANSRMDVWQGPRVGKRMKKIRLRLNKRSWLNYYTFPCPSPLPNLLSMPFWLDAKTWWISPSPPPNCGKTSCLGDCREPIDTQFATTIFTFLTRSPGGSKMGELTSKKSLHSLRTILHSRGWFCVDFSHQASKGFPLIICGFSQRIQIRTKVPGENIFCKFSILILSEDTFFVCASRCRFSHSNQNVVSGRKRARPIWVRYSTSTSECSTKARCVGKSGRLSATKSMYNGVMWHRTQHRDRPIGVHAFHFV